MKIKIFSNCLSNLAEREDDEVFEARINQWLLDTKPIVKHVLQDSSGLHWITVSVWYE